MGRKDTKTDRRTALFIWRNVIAAMIILSLIVGRQLIMQEGLNVYNDLTITVQSAYEQRTTNQKIIKDTYRLFFEKDVDRAMLLDAITSQLDQWLRVQDQIADHTANSEIISALNSAKVSLDSVYTREKSILQKYNPTGQNSLLFSELAELNILSQTYISDMDYFVSVVEADRDQRTSNLTSLDLVLFFLLVASVMVQIVFVLLPGQKKLYQSFEQIRYLGERDRLTEFLNQISFHEQVANEIMEKKNTGLMLLFLDIDEFSKIPQNKSQLVSDDVLRRTAAVIKARLRSGDYAARLSSDTFAILLHTDDNEDAKSYARILHDDISALEIPIIGKISVCTGIARFRPGEQMVDWLDRANRTLRQAKFEGKGRIVFEQQLRATEYSGTIKWSDLWNSGHLMIDEQHKSLIQLGNELISESLPTGDIGKQQELLEKFIREMINHFVCEEKIMREINFPDTTVHEVTHEQLIAKVFNMEEEFHKRNLKAGYVVNFIVEEMIVGHIATEDVKYFPYIPKDIQENPPESINQAQ